MGMKEVIRQLGLKEIIAAAGVVKVMKVMLKQMSEADRAALKRRLDQADIRKK